MDNNNAMRDFLRRKIVKETIKKRLFLKDLKEKGLNDDEIFRQYGIRPDFVIANYSSLTDEEREMEDFILKQIEAKAIDLSEEAKRWRQENTVTTNAVRPRELREGGR